MKKIVLASRNPDKIVELREILKPLDIELLSATDFPDLEEVVEDGETLQENAAKKARYVAKETGLPALADDTGLEVEALDLRPGVYSARYAGEDVTYEENVQKLLREMSPFPEEEQRKAHFRTVIAFIYDDEEQYFEGRCPGYILKEPTGNNGFGYDPVFKPKGYNQTFAELDQTEKNRISHRGKAVRKFYEWLEKHRDF